MTSGTTVNIVLSMVRFYTAMLESSPLITKSVTCSGVAALGNVISQLMQQKVQYAHEYACTPEQRSSI